MTPTRIRRAGWIGAAALALIGLSFVGGSPIYIARGVEGRIVDADTGEPLAGVVVIARWPKEGGLLHPTTVGYFAIRESVSDADGRYMIPGWGPRLRVRGTPMYYRPGLRFLKAGYADPALNNVFPGSPWDVVLRSDWDGKSVPLKPLRDDAPDGERWDQTVQDFEVYFDVLEAQGLDVPNVLPNATAALRQASSTPLPHDLHKAEGAE